MVSTVHYSATCAEYHFLLMTATYTSVALSRHATNVFSRGVPGAD